MCWRLAATTAEPRREVFCPMCSGVFGAAQPDGGRGNRTNGKARRQSRAISCDLSEHDLALSTATPALSGSCCCCSAATSWVLVGAPAHPLAARQQVSLPKAGSSVIALRSGQRHAAIYRARRAAARRQAAATPARAQLRGAIPIGGGGAGLGVLPEARAGCVSQRRPAGDHCRVS